MDFMLVQRKSGHLTNSEKQSCAGALKVNSMICDSYRKIQGHRIVASRDVMG